MKVFFFFFLEDLHLPILQVSFLHLNDVTQRKDKMLKNLVLFSSRNRQNGLVWFGFMAYQLLMVI